MSKKEVSNIVFAARTLRSRTSAGKRNSKSGSQSSTVLKAKLVAKEELAKLKLRHLEQKQRLEREMQEEMNKQKKKAEEKRLSLELLQARQGLEEVSFECQVIEEEMEHGGYLLPEEKNAQFQEPQVKWDLDNSNFPIFENQARLEGPDSEVYSINIKSTRS